MRRIITTMAALSLIACGGRSAQPLQVSAPAPSPRAETLSCVRGELDEMAYEVSAADQAAGTIQGVRTTEQPWWRSLLGFRDVIDQLTASLEGGTLRVTAASTDPDATIVGGASSAAERDARQLLAACSGAG